MTGLVATGWHYVPAAHLSTQANKHIEFIRFVFVPRRKEERFFPSGGSRGKQALGFNLFNENVLKLRHFGFVRVNFAEAHVFACIVVRIVNHELVLTSAD